MKKVYIVLTYTGTLLSSAIKHYTKYKYSHISISLDKELTEMYSFGRLFAYNPFVAGFIHEELERGTFKRFKNTDCLVYSLEISDISYKKLTNKIAKMKQNKHIYRYNFIGLFGIILKKKINRKNYFYCAEFVKYILESSDVELNLPALIKPQDFNLLENLTLVYQGTLRNYNRAS